MFVNGLTNMRKLPAFSLIETLVAMTIVVTTLGGLFLISIRAQEAGKGPRELHARLVLDEMARDVKRTNQYLDRAYEEEGISYIQEVRRYNDQPGLYLLSSFAKSADGKMLAERKEL